MINEHIIGYLLLIATGCCLLILILLHLISLRVSDIMRSLRQMIGYWHPFFKKIPGGWGGGDAQIPLASACW